MKKVLTFLYKKNFYIMTLMNIVYLTTLIFNNLTLFVLTHRSVG